MHLYFRLECIDWQAVAALGTWAAVLAALFLPFWQNRRRLVITVQRNMCIFSPGSTSDSVRYIGIVCVNAGSSDVVIKNWYIKVEGSADGFCLRAFDFNSLYGSILSPTLPCRIQASDSFSCGLEKNTLCKSLSEHLDKGRIQSDDWLVAHFTDSLGKDYEKVLNITVQQVIDDCKTGGRKS